MAKYRRKPIVTDATRWFKNGDHPDDYKNTTYGHSVGHDENGQETEYLIVEFPGEVRRKNGWEGGVVRYFRHPDVDGKSICPQCGKTMHEHGWIDTPEGGHNVCPGDWIITGINGEYYPIKNDIFEKTYEPVTDGSEN